MNDNILKAVIVKCRKCGEGKWEGVPCKCVRDRRCAKCGMFKLPRGFVGEYKLCTPCSNIKTKFFPTRSSGMFDTVI